MKRRVFAALLAGAMVLSLAACGGGNGGGSASSNPGSGSDVSAIAPGGSSSQPDASQPDGSNPDASNPDGSQPDASVPDGGSAGGSASSAEGLQPGDGSQSDSKLTLTLNKTDVTLKKAGASFRLRYTAKPDTDGVPSFTSDKPEIATVDESGNVTAVAPGQATITVEYDGAKASCVVRCRWDEQSDSSSSSGSSSGSSSSQVDLASFYSTITGKYQFSFMTEADDTTLTNFFAGLSDLSLSQRVVYLCGMSPAPVGDFALVQVSDSKDVDKVKSIFQARIDYMVGDGNGPGGAWYPGPTEMWENQSRIVTNGNYVMLIVHENCDDIVKEFNALF